MRLLSFIDGEAGYCALLSDDDGSSALRVNDDGPMEARADTPPADGRAILDSGAGALEVSWSPAGSALELGVGEAVIGVHAVAVSGRHADRSLSGPGVAWDLPENGYSALRTIWAAAANGSLLLLVSLRSSSSDEHGEELTGAARLIPGAEPYGYVEPLLSTEYDASGAQTRATLELWSSVEEHAPERGGGLRAGGGSIATPHGRLAAARFGWSLDGSNAFGGYEILTP